MSLKKRNLNTVVKSLKDGTQIILRPLATGDSQALINYFQELSDRTKSYFSPHEFDNDTINKICQDIDNDPTRRFVALAGDKIIAYFLLYTEISSYTRNRYDNLDDNSTYAFAPSVADDYQNRGLGTTILSYAIDIAKSATQKYLILAGGVQARNTSAVKFYQKNGFEIIRKFEIHGENYDMMLTF